MKYDPDYQSPRGGGMDRVSLIAFLFCANCGEYVGQEEIPGWITTCAIRCHVCEKTTSPIRQLRNPGESCEVHSANERSNRP